MSRAASISPQPLLPQADAVGLAASGGDGAERPRCAVGGRAALPASVVAVAVRMSGAERPRREQRVAPAATDAIRCVAGATTSPRGPARRSTAAMHYGGLRRAIAARHAPATRKPEKRARGHRPARAGGRAAAAHAQTTYRSSGTSDAPRAPPQSHLQRPARSSCRASRLIAVPPCPVPPMKAPQHAIASPSRSGERRAATARRGGSLAWPEPRPF